MIENFVYILVPTAKAMEGEPINRVNNILQDTFVQMKQNPYLLESGGFSITTFDETPKLLVPPVSISDISYIPLIKTSDSNVIDFKQAFASLNVANAKTIQIYVSDSIFHHQKMQDVINKLSDYKNIAKCAVITNVERIGGGIIDFLQIWKDWVLSACACDGDNYEDFLNDISYYNILDTRITIKL